MKAAAAHHSAPLVRDPGAPPGALARVGSRDNTAVTVMRSRDGRHTRTVLPAEGLRPTRKTSRATLAGSRGGGWAWTVSLLPAFCETTRATRRYDATPATAAPPASVRTPEAGATR